MNPVGRLRPELGGMRHHLDGSPIGGTGGWGLKDLHEVRVAGPQYRETLDRLTLARGKRLYLVA